MKTLFSVLAVVLTGCAAQVVDAPAGAACSSLTVDEAGRAGFSCTDPDAVPFMCDAFSDGCACGPVQGKVACCC